MFDLLFFLVGLGVLVGVPAFLLGWVIDHFQDRSSAKDQCPDCGSTYLIRIPISAPYGQGGWNGHQHPGSPARGERMVGLLIKCKDCGHQWPY